MNKSMPTIQYIINKQQKIQFTKFASIEFKNISVLKRSKLFNTEIYNQRSDSSTKSMFVFTP